VGWGYRTHGEIRNAYKIMVGEPERKRLLRRPSSKLKDNIKINLKEGGRGLD
jgi:hypothetical protein